MATSRIASATAGGASASASGSVGSASTIDIKAPLWTYVNIIEKPKTGGWCRSSWSGWTLPWWAWIASCIFWSWGCGRGGEWSTCWGCRSINNDALNCKLSLITYSSFLDLLMLCTDCYFPMLNFDFLLLWTLICIALYFFILKTSETYPCIGVFWESAVSAYPYRPRYWYAYPYPGNLDVRNSSRL